MFVFQPRRRTSRRSGPADEQLSTGGRGGGCCIDARWQERRRNGGEKKTFFLLFFKSEKSNNGRKNRFSRPTGDVHIHDARASSNAVGGVADVCAGQVKGHGALEEQRVVPDLHVGGQGAVQAAEENDE